MKNWTKVVVSAALASIGGAALSASAHAQEQFPTLLPPCVIVADKVIFTDGRTFTSAGTMDLEAIQSSEPGEAFQWLLFRSSSFNATTEDPELGTVVWELDNTRDAVSTIRSTQEGSLFPAALDLFFFVRATISSQPGVEFVSAAPVRMQPTIVFSFPPCPQRLIAADPIDFVTEDNPDEVAFTVGTLESTIN